MPVFNRLWQYWFAYQGRTHQKQSLKWLAEAAGVSTPTLRRYLDNSTRCYDPEVMDRLCRVLEIPVSEFFYQADMQYPELAGHSGRVLNISGEDNE